MMSPSQINSKTKLWNISKPRSKHVKGKREVAYLIYILIEKSMICSSSGPKMAVFKVTTVQVKPFNGQKSGTSGPARRNAGKTLVVSGDGRCYLKDAIQMVAANGVRSIWVGQNGLLSTPAISAIIRGRVGQVDFGIKYNMENGGSALEGVADKRPIFHIWGKR